MTSKQIDSDTGDVLIVRRPRAQWQRREVTHLRIVSDEMWQKTQARLKECHQAYRKRVGEKAAGATRTSAYPTVLVRPVCGYCGSELWLGRSGKYASFCCLNGSGEKNECKLRTYKTVSIVEKAIVNHLKSVVFTPEFVTDLVDKANAHLRSEASRPKGNAGSIRAEIKSLERKQGRLVEVCAAGGGEVSALVAKLKECDGQLTELRGRLREVEGPTELPPPVTVTDIERLVADLHALLEEDTATVAPILRELTGPVTVTQEKQEGKRGATWIAQFEVNLVPVLARLTRQQDCPSSGAWVFLNTAGWTSPRACKLTVDFIPKHESLVDEVNRLAAGGASLRSIATTLGEAYATVRNAHTYGRSGERPKTEPPGQRTGTRTGPPKYEALAPQVARLRDDEHVPFTKIAVRLKISEVTARAAYAHAHREDIGEAVRVGQPVQWGRHVRVEHAVRCDVRERLDRGESVAFIADATGCSASTVRRISREE